MRARVSSRSYFSGRQPVRNRRRRLCKLWYMCRGLPNRSYQRGIILKEFLRVKLLREPQKEAVKLCFTASFLLRQVHLDQSHRSSFPVPFPVYKTGSYTMVNTGFPHLPPHSILKIQYFFQTSIVLLSLHDPLPDAF